MSEQRLAKMLVLLGKGARFSVKPLLLYLCASVATMLLSVVYFRGAIEWSWAWALLPLYLLVLPLLALLYYWFALEGISRLPEALVDSKETWAILQERYAARREKSRQKREIKGIGPVATMRRMLLLGGLLWDSRDVIDTASNLFAVKDLFNPLFWIVQLISLACSFLFSTALVLTCAIHFFFL